MKVTHNETVSEIENTFLINGEKEIKVTLNNYEDLVSLMFEDISGLLGKLSKSEKVLLKDIIVRSLPVEGYEGNIVLLNTTSRIKIARELNLQKTTVTINIGLFKKKGLIYSTKKRGCYMLNPVFFFRGRIGEKTKRLRLILEYTIQ